MATLKEALQYAKSNPNDPRNAELFKAIKNGDLDKQAAEEGINISGLRQTRVETTGNVGTGFVPTREFTGEEGVGETIGKTLRNVPRSGFEFGKNILNAVINPIDTVRSVGSLLRGTGAKAGELALERTDIGQELLARQNERRIEAGMQPLLVDEQGRMQAPENEDLQAVNAVGQFFKERYGSLDNFKETVVEDPVGVLADFAGLASGGGALLRSTKVPSLVQRGQQLSRLGNAAEPTTLATRAVGGATRGTRQFARDVSSDIVPGATEIKRSGVAQALDLTQSDLRQIKNKTQVDVGDFILEKGFTGQPDEIIAQLGDYADDVRGTVRDIVGGVNKTYTFNDVPSVKQALTSLQELYGSTPGLEDVQSELRALVAKQDLTLSDIQKTKELIDDADLIFTKAGDIKAGVQSKGLANIRRDIRKFIEDEAPQGSDIQALNKEVQTAQEIRKAAILRETRGLTRQQLPVFDLLVGLGGAAAFDPITGLGLVVAKRAIQSPAFKLGVARALKGLPESTVSKMLSEIKNNTVTQETRQIIRGVYQQAAENAGITLPALENIEETTSTR